MGLGWLALAMLVAAGSVLSSGRARKHVQFVLVVLGEIWELMKGNATKAGLTWKRSKHLGRRDENAGSAHPFEVQQIDF